MAEESQYCNSRELYEARMKNEELRRQHKDTCQCSCPGAELVKTETRRRRAASGTVLELPGERLEGIDFNKGFEQAVQLVAYNGRRFDFTVLKKQSSEYAVESVMDA